MNDLRTYLFEHRIKGADLTRATRGRLTAQDISRIVNRSEPHYPPSKRVRALLRTALIKVGAPVVDVDQIEDLTAE
jgi:hypothetical protein